MAKKTSSKGALSKDPGTKNAAPFDAARTQRRVDYLKRVRPNDPEIRKLQGQITKFGAATTETSAPTPTPTQGERVAETSGNVFEQMAGYAQQFDPRTFQTQYEPIYSAEMDRARQNILGQFERRNAEEFERQNIDTQRQIAERGLDPNSPAAQALMKQNTQRQDLARQEALSAAESAAQGVNQQIYQQATGAALLPQQIASGFMDPYQASMQQRFLNEQGLQQFEQQKALAAQRQRYDLELIAKTPRGGGGGGGGGGAAPDYYGQYLLGTLGQGYNQQPQVNPWAAGAQGLAAGFGQGFGQNLGRKVGS